MSLLEIRSSPFNAPVAERTECGRAARSVRPRADLGTWSPAPDRPDPVALLQRQEASRIAPLLPLRHERMAASAFAFYRGTALIMASDLGSMNNSGLIVQLCGDAHLSNFGLFAAPDRQPVFDLNDFDETNPGPFEWDVQRLAVSFALAARDNSLPGKIGAEAVAIVARQYRDSMVRYAAMKDIDIWYDRVDATQLLTWAQATGGKKAMKALDRVLGKARRRDTWSALAKLTVEENGERHFIDDPPLIVRVPEASLGHSAMLRGLDDYRDSLDWDRRMLLARYRTIDVGHKIVGVGSVGLLAWVVLLQGRDSDDLLALQVKQAQASVLEAFTQPSMFPQHGQRVVEGQRLIQAASDSFLGWTSGKYGRQYYVRQLRDMKWSPDPGNLGSDALRTYAGLCGHVLARAHARSGDPIAIAAYLGGGRAFEQAVGEFADRYVPQVDADYAEFQAALVDGRLATGDTASDPSTWRAAFADPTIHNAAVQAEADNG